MKSCKETGSHYSNSFLQSTERKTVTVAQWIRGSRGKISTNHYIHIKKLPLELSAVEFPGAITKNNSAKPEKWYVITLSPMAIMIEPQACLTGGVLGS